MRQKCQSNNFLFFHAQEKDFNSNLLCIEVHVFFPPKHFDPEPFNYSALIGVGGSEIIGILTCNGHNFFSCIYYKSSCP